jgi:DNA-binding transcriptional LysR family regulator
MKQADNLADLHLLVEVIDAGGLAAAAQKLGTTRSLVSRRLIALETRLGVSLLQRNARGLNVTPTGQEVYRHAVLMCEAAHAALIAASNGQAGLLRVAAHGLLSPLLDELVAFWGTTHPRERLITRSTGDTSALLQEHLDLLLDVDAPIPAEGLVDHALGSMRLVVVASPELLDRLKRPSRPELVEDEHWLAFAGAPWSLRGVAPRQLQPRLASDHLPTLLAAARAGMGLVQVPLYACREDLLGGRLDEVFQAFEARPLALHARVPKVSAADPFIAALRQHLAGMEERGVFVASA